MSKPVDRHIIEQRWREEGRLDELVGCNTHPPFVHSVSWLQMERIHQMFVVPDVVPSLHPSVDLRVTYPEYFVGTMQNGESKKRKHALVEPGTYLHPQQVGQFVFWSPEIECSPKMQTIEPPKLYTDVFHTDTRLYTLLLVDPGELYQPSTSYTH